MSKVLDHIKKGVVQKDLDADQIAKEIEKKKAGGKHRLTLDLSKGEFEEIKQEATKNGQTIKGFIMVAVRKHLKG